MPITTYACDHDDSCIGAHCARCHAALCLQCPGCDCASSKCTCDERRPMTDTPLTDQQLADALVAAIRDAAYDCDGTCGLDERDCDTQHPIQVSALRHGVVASVYADIEPLADAVLAVVRPELDRLPADRVQHRNDAFAEAAAVLVRIADETEAKVAEHYGPASGIGPGSAEMVREAARTVRSLAAAQPTT